MNLHRYIAKISSPNSGESRFEFLGTWIGFAGLLLFILHVTVADNIRSASGTAIIVIGLSYCIYWFSTQHKYVIYLLALLTGIVSVLIGWSGVSNLVSCHMIEYKYGGSNCNKMDFINFAYFVYFLSIFVISIYYIRGLRGRTA